MTRIIQVHEMFKRIIIGGDKLDGEGEGIRIHRSWKGQWLDLVEVVEF